MPTTALGVLAAAGLLGGLAAVAPLATRPAAAPPEPAPRLQAAAAGSGASPVPMSPVPMSPVPTSPVPTSPVPGSPVPRWRWPLLVTPRVVRGFQPPPQRWLPGHRGVDLAAVPGDTVVAAGAGVVGFAGPLAGRGVVTVSHGELRTTYEPVTALVAVGDTVAAGEPIGTLAAGASHCGGYPACLHWGLLRGTTYLDPLLLLGVSHPILLPIPRHPAS